MQNNEFAPMLAAKYNVLKNNLIFLAARGYFLKIMQLSFRM